MTTPKSIKTLNLALAAIGGPAALESIGATNIQMASPRTFRFDLPAGTVGKEHHNINRVKITAREDDTLDIRFIEMVEHDLVGGVPVDNTRATIEAFTGLKFATPAGTEG